MTKIVPEAGVPLNDSCFNVVKKFDSSPKISMAGVVVVEPFEEV